jgi:hypothetical protein
MRCLIALLFLAGLLFCPPVNAKTERETLIETFARLSASVGALYALEQGGTMRFLCSATAVAREDNKTVILTAGHCVQKGVSYLITFGGNQFHPLSVWQIPHYEIGKAVRAYGEPETDMALFLMENGDMPIVELDDGSEMVAGEKLAMVGFPLGIAKISYEGTVAGHMNRPGANNHGYMLMQIFGAPGSSGSAVVAAKTGKIVAILVAGKRGDAGLPVIFGTPISYKKYLKPVPGSLNSEVNEAPSNSPG